MALNIRDLARMCEFSFELKSLGTVRCLSLNTDHLSQANKKLGVSGGQSIDFVRWLFGQMVKRPIEGYSGEADQTEAPRLTMEELSSVTDVELEEFSVKLIQKNRYLLKTHKGSDIEMSADESACDFLVRAFRHHDAEQKTQWERMTQSASNSLFTSATLKAIQHNIGLSAQFHDTIKAYNQSTLDREITRASIEPIWSRIPEISAAQEQVARLQAASRCGTEYSDENRIDRFSTASDIRRALDANQHNLAMFSSSTIDEVRSIAELAQMHTLHASLDPFRTPVESFANKLLHLQTLDTIRSPAYLDAFIQASTISDVFLQSIRVDHQLQDATRHFAQAAVPPFGSLNDYRQFLDAAGLWLSHWPHTRLLSIGEKRRRLRAKLNNNTEPNHVKNAKSLVHRYELTLRDILDDAMASAYGEDWAAIRLPLCNCNDLLGKWKKRGGEILAHADYAHYERIMSNPEHFEAVFEAGFDDLTALAELIRRAGDLRATLHHCHPFSPEDLRDLRLIWRTIETGLLALTEDYEFES